MVSDLNCNKLWLSFLPFATPDNNHWRRTCDNYLPNSLQPISYLGYNSLNLESYLMFMVPYLVWQSKQQWRTCTFTIFLRVSVYKQNYFSHWALKQNTTVWLRKYIILKFYNTLSSLSRDFQIKLVIEKVNKYQVSIDVKLQLGEAHSKVTEVVPIIIIVFYCKHFWTKLCNFGYSALIKQVF